ncbi:MAG: hypothetical protein AAGF82_14935 [Pseudomonadota bacterium]
MTIRFTDDQTAATPTLEDIIARNVRRSAEQENALPALHQQYRDVGIAALAAATLCMRYGSKSRKRHGKRDRAAA